MTQPLKTPVSALRSMTGFARREAALPAGTLIWEVRTVNHRYLEVSLRLPEDFRALEAEVRLYARLFLDPQPDAGGKDYLESLNPNSLKIVTAIVEPSLANAQPDEKFQFERHGYFVADRVDHAAGKPVFNFEVGLKDSFGK
jgi:hypothetical protein